MIRAMFDEKGLPTAFYESGMHGDRIPAEAIEITEAQWLELINNAGRRRFDFANLAVVDYVPPPAPLDVAKLGMVERIDSHAAAIYSRWTRFEAEYRARESAAQAFRDAGYQGDPGLYVTSFAAPAGLTTRAAADAILAQDAALRAAQDSLAALRMRKYEVARAADAITSQTLADEIITEMDAIARRIG